MLITRHLRIGLEFGLVLVLSGLLHAQAPYAYLDTFEASTINRYWTSSQQYGTVTLSTEKNHTAGGRQSLKFSSSEGGERDIAVSHSFATPQKGLFSIWFYDVAPGQETQYEQISVTNSRTGDIASVGTQDFDAYCYEAQLFNYLTQQQQGPNQNCGSYPQISTTNVHRMAGWHNFSIFAGNDSVTLAIDGTAVFTASGNYAYDSITISQSGPVWRPDTTSYWDDSAVGVWRPN